MENGDCKTVDSVWCDMDACVTHFDEDNDNKLNIKEFNSLCKALFRDDKGHIYPLDEEKARHIFGVFDKNNDGFVDRDEFIFCWNHWIKVILKPVSVLLVVDVQNDFISGSLKISDCNAKHNGYDVVPPINNLLDSVTFDGVFYSLDWHPENHASFYDNLSLRELHPTCTIPVNEVKVGDEVIFTGPPMMKMKLWPRHCVENTWGAELHKDLKIADGARMVHKATNPEIDAYSVFWDNVKSSKTELIDLLKEKNATDLYICGIAYDVCVGATCVDALGIGYRTILIEDCCRGVDECDIEKTKNKITSGNGLIVNSKDVLPMVQGKDRRPELGYKLAMELKNAV